MSVLSPWMLSFLIVLPLILAFYLLKRTYVETAVPSILLWQQLLRDMEANRPWQKLRSNLLLLLQLLIALLLALALARPAIPSTAPVADHTIIVLDLSPSMAAMDGESTRLDQNKQQVKTLIAGLAPKQTMTLIAMGQEARVLATGHDRATLQNAVDGAAQEYGKADYEGALSLAAALSSKEAGSDVRIYSDGNWGIDPLMLPIFGSSPKLITPEGTAPNLSISHAAAVTQGKHTAMVATVDNAGEEARVAQVQVFDEQGHVLEAVELEVLPGTKQSHSWSELPNHPFYKVAVTSEDGLALDNERIVLPETGSAVKVWIASEGNLFLEKALSVGGALTLEHGADADTPSEDADLYVYDGVLPTSWPNGSVLLIDPPTGNGIINTTGEVEAGKLEVVTPDSPILSHVDLSKLHVKSVQGVESASWLQPLIKSGETPLLLIGEQDGHRVAVLTFDLHQSDLPLLPAFPLLIKHLKEYLMPVTGQTLGTMEAGGRMTLLPPIRETGWHYLDPAGEKHAVDQKMIEQGFVPRAPGLYRFQGEQTGMERLLSVTLPSDESKLTPVNVLLPTTGAGEEGTPPLPTAQFEVGHLEVWRYLALLILLFAFLEWGVYKRGY